MEEPTKDRSSQDTTPATLTGEATEWLRKIPSHLAAYVRTLWLATVAPIRLVDSPTASGTMSLPRFALSSATVLYVVVVASFGSDPLAAYELPELPRRIGAILDVVPLGPFGIPLLLLVGAVYATASIYVALWLVRSPVSLRALVELAAVYYAGPVTAAFAIGTVVAWAVPGETNFQFAGLIIGSAVLAWYLVRYLPTLSILASAKALRILAAALLSFGIGAGLNAILPSFALTYKITSQAMYPTLQEDDHILANPTVFWWRVPKRAEVITFDAPHLPGARLVFRVVGLPGDTLQMRNRVLIRNGTAVREPYVADSDEADTHHAWMQWQLDHLVGTLDPDSYRPTRDTWGPLAIPTGRYFVLGDNRDFSLDSRYWGLLSRSQLVGPVFFRYWPWARGGALNDELPTP